MTSNTMDRRGHFGPAGNLPAEPNVFIGRERDLADLISMLERVRAVTLCGPGGIGKTRLALKLAASLANGYADGAWIVDLADATAPDQLVPLLAAALGIRAEPDRPLADTLIEALRGMTMLLVLDTCERQVQAAAELVRKVLDGCPRLRVIATSREALRVRGEVIWRVPPLGLPAAAAVASDGSSSLVSTVADSESVRLFVSRASAVTPGFSLDADNAPAVAEVCTTLGGVPLGIELAAARVRMLSAEEIRLRLASRFELLARGDRTAPQRQQTLRATVEWSFDLLTSAERKLLSRLSVFSGWSLEMAERVCADSQLPAAGMLDLLTALIDKSLVIVDGEVSGVERYRLLDAVREMAAEQVCAEGERSALQAAQRDCMLAMMLDIAARAFVRGDPPWTERVAMYHRARAERANCRLALRYCVERGDAEAGLLMCHALSGSWLASGDVAEGADWLDQLLAIDADVAPGARARALAVRAELAFEQQDFLGAAQFAAACLDLSEASGDGNPATALRLQALTLLVAGRAQDALPLAESALRAARQMSDDWEEGVALATRAAVLAGLGLLEQAQLGYAEALEVLSGNNRWAVANVLYGLGQLARSRGDAAGAATYFRDALAIYREIDARPEMARCLGGIGLVALSQSDIAVAQASLTESVQLNLSTGQRLGVARGLATLAALAMAAGDADRAVKLAGTALALFDMIGVPNTTAAVRRLDDLVVTAGRRLGRDAAAALVAYGKATSPHDAVRLVSSGTRSDVARRADDSAASARVAAAPTLFEPSAPGDDHNSDHAWPGPLTERECEIAALVARGLSNRAIGDELYITQATAARHIANIFTKLGFSSRAQITAWVLKSVSNQP
jgi:predicted ATPase/DNA-binding CsgD family transcriptional regulator